LIAPEKARRMRAPERKAAGPPWELGEEEAEGRETEPPAALCGCSRPAHAREPYSDQSALEPHSPAMDAPPLSSDQNPTTLKPCSAGRKKHGVIKPKYGLDGMELL
jgi:hypothetical protein